VEVAAGKEITTVEGLEQDGRLHPVQQAFVNADALQCGYCTPGMIMSAVALLRDHPKPSEPEIRSAMQGNICRCGAYSRIVSAIANAKSPAPPNARRNGGRR
jgi:aerobic-type carbon monoxide dehydrogenase small subunit (CoxS/CutS family)